MLEKLAYHAKNGDQTCWPTVKGIAKGMCMSEREVMRSLKTLRQQKLITKVGTSLTNDAVIYRVNVVSTFSQEGGGGRY